jgi:hypothetical protein
MGHLFDALMSTEKTNFRQKSRYHLGPPPLLLKTALNQIRRPNISAVGKGKPQMTE